jgi:hypothetical protein
MMKKFLVVLQASSDQELPLLGPTPYKHTYKRDRSWTVLTLHIGYGIEVLIEASMPVLALESY